jgi:prepilin-type N-terminal cleavage/methylation domain-containing protein
MSVIFSEKYKNEKFTLIELLMVIAIIGILSSFMFPSFSTARSTAKFARWQVYKNNLRADPALVLYYDFEDIDGNKINNQSVNLEGFNSFDSQRMNGVLKGKKHLPEWTNKGRWLGKGALTFSRKTKIVIPDSEFFEGMDNLSVEAWVKPYTKGGAHGIITKWTAVTGGPFLLRLWHHNKVTFFVQTGEGKIRKGYSFATSSVRIPQNKWSYLVGTYDGEEIKIYINGKLSGTKEWNKGTALRGITDMVIGEDRNNKHSFRGKIDEVAVYRRALTAEEIKMHYDIGHP